MFLIKFESPRGREFSEGRTWVLLYTQNLVENLSLVLKVEKKAERI